MRNTQLESWSRLQPELNKRQQQVLQALKELGNSATNRQLAKHLDWEINRITGRINELCYMKKVVGHRTIKDPETNRKVTLWQRLNVGFKQAKLW